MGQAETKIFEKAPAWHESDVLATTDFEEEVRLLILRILCIRCILNK